MQSSILLKIGIIGTVVSIVTGFVPLLAPFLGNGALKQWIGTYINETNLTVLLIIFAAMIFYAILKKDRES